MGVNKDRPHMFVSINYTLPLARMTDARQNKQVSSVVKCIFPKYCSGRIFNQNIINKIIDRHTKEGNAWLMVSPTCLQ